MKDISVSIIVPIYNSEKYLKRCIDSLINQTIREIEIILINDGSTDGSLEILKEFKNKDERIKIINKKNGGVSSARNIGIDLARGKYISFVDSDDWCDLNMFEIMYNVATKYNSDFASVGYLMENYKGKVIKKESIDRFVYSNDRNEVSKIMSKLELGFSVMKLYKKSIIDRKNIRFNTNISFGEDAIFVQEYIMNIKSIAAINKFSYHYVRCNNNSLSIKYVKNMNEFLKLYWDEYEKMGEIFPKYKEIMSNKGHKKEISGTMINLYNNYRKESPLNISERIEFIKKIMNDKRVNKALTQYKAEKFSHKVFVFLYKMKIPIIMDFIYILKYYITNLIMRIS